MHLRAADGWRVSRIPHAWAVPLVQRLHYSENAANTSTLAAGLISPGERLVGCALWMPAPRGAAVATAKRCGMEPGDVAYLSRLAIEPGVPTNGASFLLARSRRLLDGARVCLTYADPAEDHTGAIYLADNWHQAGTGGQSYRWTDSDGRMRCRQAGRGLTVDEMLRRGWTRERTPPKLRFMRHVNRRDREAVRQAAVRWAADD